MAYIYMYVISHGGHRDMIKGVSNDGNDQKHFSVLISV